MGMSLAMAVKDFLKFGVRPISGNLCMQQEGDARHIEINDDETAYLNMDTQDVFIRITTTETGGV